MSAAESSIRIEVVTAVMLGLVSVVTALGAWYAGTLSGVADEFGDDSNDARDVSVNQSVLADYSLRIDQEASLNAVRYAEAKPGADDLETLFYDIRIQTQLGRTTPGFAEAWFEWSAAGFPDDSSPLEDPDYIVAREKVPDSYSYVSRVLGDAKAVVSTRAGVLGQAALIQALALFLFGISGVNRLRPVRVGIVALGVGVFLAGLVLASTAV
jgi:hypothetical protein